MSRRFEIQVSREIKHPWLLVLLLPVALILNLLLTPLILLDPRSWRFNKAEAREVLKKHLEALRRMSLDEVKANLTDRGLHCIEVRGDSGATYQIEVEPVEQLNLDKELKLVGSIDDGRLRAYFPLTETVFVPWDGSAVPQRDDRV